MKRHDVAEVRTRLMPLWLAFFIRVLCKLGKDLSVLLLYQLVEKCFLAFIEINSIKETADYNLQ